MGRYEYYVFMILFAILPWAFTKSLEELMSPWKGQRTTQGETNKRTGMNPDLCIQLFRYIIERNYGDKIYKHRVYFQLVNIPKCLVVISEGHKTLTRSINALLETLVLDMPVIIIACLKNRVMQILYLLHIMSQILRDVKMF